MIDMQQLCLQHFVQFVQVLLWANTPANEYLLWMQFPWIIWRCATQTILMRFSPYTHTRFALDRICCFEHINYDNLQLTMLMPIELLCNEIMRLFSFPFIFRYRLHGCVSHGSTYRSEASAIREGIHMYCYYVNSNNNDINRSLGRTAMLKTF